jgi:redox-sensitive bicupin YhaK (pirin superfamily)
MRDQFGSDDPYDYIAGFPDHPHRGFITVTYLLDGHMQHQDSMGNRGDLRPGSVQWMKAASGVIHSEMPQQEHGMMRGFQLWLNLPASEKMSDPAYQEFSADKIPLLEENGKRVKVISGEYQGVHGPVNDPHTGVVYLDVELAPGTVFQQQVNPQANAFIYVFEGSASIAGKTAPTHSLLVLGPGDSIEIATGDERARFILVAGNPLNEPVVHYGPFVMNSREEIMQAVDDFNRGKLVRTKAAMTV